MREALQKAREEGNKQVDLNRVQDEVNNVWQWLEHNNPRPFYPGQLLFYKEKTMVTYTLEFKRLDERHIMATIGCKTYVVHDVKELRNAVNDALAVEERNIMKLGVEGEDHPTPGGSTTDLQVGMLGVKEPG